jgi:hypothetical protein
MIKDCVECKKLSDGRGNASPVNMAKNTLASHAKKFRAKFCPITHILMNIFPLAPKSGRTGLHLQSWNRCGVHGMIREYANGTKAARQT